MTWSLTLPSLWPLLALGLVPLVLWLLDRQRAPRVAWPTIRFFLGEDRASLRRPWLRDVLLLLARTIGVVALVLAILGPERRGPELVSGTAGRRWILTFDRSTSMEYRSGDGISRLDRARAFALHLLAAASVGDDVLLDGTPMSVARAVGWIEELRATGAPFDLARALDDARVAAEHSPRPTRGAWILSDLPPPQEIPLLPCRVPLVVVDCNDGQTPVNGSIASITVLDPAPGAGERAALAVALAGEAASGPTGALSITVDDLAPHDLASPSRADLAAETEVLFPESGAIPVTARRDEDGLGIDDALTSVVHVRRSLDVLVLAGRGERSAESIERALTAGGERSIVRALRRFDLVPEDLERADVAVVAEGARLDADAAHRLATFVARGGGLVLFAGGWLDDEEVESALYRSGGGLLPARVEADATAPEGAPWRPADVRLSHPIFSAFRLPEDGDPALLEFERALVSGPSADADVIARLSSGAPWMIERAFGRGRVVFVTTPTGAPGANLDRTPLFQPLMERLARHVAPSTPVAATIHLGDPLRADVEGQVTITRPDGANLARVATPGVPLVEAVDTAGVWTIAAAAAGSIRDDELDSTMSVRHVVVRVDPDESALPRASETELRRLLDASGASLVPAGAAAEDATATPMTRSYWPWLVALSLVSLVAELVLLSTIGSRPGRLS